jgi:alpha-tubulin suppressor-like RCC1 family protein
MAMSRHLKQSKLFLGCLMVAASMLSTGCLNNKDKGELARTNGELTLRPQDKTVLFGQSDLAMRADGGTPPYQFDIVTEQSAHTIDLGTGLFHQVAVTSLETAVVRVTDATGDIKTTHVYIAPALTLTLSSPTVIKTGTISAVASGGAGKYTYAISTGPGTIASDAAPATSATYTAPNFVGVAFITVYDESGNAATASVSIIDDLSLSPNLISIPDNLTQQMTASGGLQPYTFSLDPSTNFGSIDPTSGVYTPARPSSTPAPVTIAVTDTRTPTPVTQTSSLSVFVATRIAVGLNHACAITPLRKLECWGSNYYGQLGNGFSVYGDSAAAMGDSLPSVALGTVYPYVVDFAHGGAHGCAIVSASAVATVGYLKCWGRNDQGQLGLNSTSNKGELMLQMGDSLPTVTFSSTAIENGQVKKVVIGASHTCVLYLSGGNNTIKCWGFNLSGQLGQQTAANYGYNTGLNAVTVLSPVNVGLTAGQSIIDIAVGGSTSCALIAQDAAGAAAGWGYVKCWGASANGQAGQDTVNSSIGTTAFSMGTDLRYANLDSNMHVKKLSVGDKHVCAIVDNPTAGYSDQVVCWGSNASGQLGRNSNTGNSVTIGDQAGEMATVVPVDLDGTGPTHTVNDVSAGVSHTCVVYDNTYAKCWGLNSSGQLGNNTTINVGTATALVKNQPAISYAGASIKSISAGDAATCVMVQFGASKYSKCWGDNFYGTLGIGTAPTSALPTNFYKDAMDPALPFTLLSSANTIVKVTAPRSGAFGYDVPFPDGQYVGCAMMATGEIKCWGRPRAGANGQRDPYIGDEVNEMGNNLQPASLGTGYDVLEVKTKNNFNCAVIRPTGSATVRKLKCWGYNTYGNLGNGEQTYHRGDNPGEMGDSLPFVDFGTHNVVDFSVGTNHACAIVDGISGNQSGLTCWGFQGNYAALGNGLFGTFPSNSTLAPSYTNFVYLSANGTTFLKAKKVQAGNGLTCAIAEDARVYCFGDNANGELGMGNTGTTYRTRGQSTLNYVPPIDVGTSDGTTPLKVLDVAVGDSHVCVIVEGGKVKCWGLNASGQLGLQYVLSPKDIIGNNTGEMGDSLAYTDFGTSVLARQIFAGPNNTCIISTAAKLFCIGYGNFGVNGIAGNTLNIGANANQMGDFLAPVDVGPNRTVINVSVGPESACAVLDNNTLKCWGANGTGKLGLGNRLTYGGNVSNSMGIYLPFVSLNLN